MKFPPIRCSDCGRFIGRKDLGAQVYTPFGNTLDTEPPEDKYVCGKCFQSPSKESLIRKISWAGPTRIFG